MRRPLRNVRYFCRAMQTESRLSFKICSESIFILEFYLTQFSRFSFLKIDSSYFSSKALSCIQVSIGSVTKIPTSTQLNKLRNVCKYILRSFTIKSHLRIKLHSFSNNKPATFQSHQHHFSFCRKPKYSTIIYIVAVAAAAIK